MRVTQTEFWTDEMGLKARAAAPARSQAAEDYFAGEEVDERAGGLPSWGDVPPEDKLEVSEPVEILQRRLARIERSVAAPAPEDVSPSGCAEALRLTPIETVARARATVVRRSESVAPIPAARFNMTRLLTLTGSLDNSDDGDRLLQLPGRAFRAVLTMTERRRISKDFLKDLRSPPRNATIPKYGSSKNTLIF